MSKLFKNNLPGTYNFISDFFEAMNNKATGHSLRKWLAVGFFWLMAEVILRYANEENVIAVLGVLAGMITALIITYTAGNIAQQKVDKVIKDSTNDQES